MKPDAGWHCHNPQNEPLPRQLPGVCVLASTSCYVSAPNYPSHPDGAGGRVRGRCRLPESRNHALFMLLHSSHFLAQV